MKHEEKWCIWRVTYGTYADVERAGDIKPQLLTCPLELVEAMKAANKLGFGHCVKRWDGE